MSISHFCYHFVAVSNRIVSHYVLWFLSVIVSCYIIRVLKFVSQSVSNSVRYVVQVDQSGYYSVGQSIHTFIHFFCMCVCWFFFYLYQTFTHAFTQFLFCVWGVSVRCGTVYFFVLGEQQSYLLFLKDLGDPEKGLFGVSILIRTCGG